MTFAAVIPLYNKPLSIQRAIESVLMQTTAVSEIVVVNDGSTDESAMRVAEMNCERVTLIHQPNGGEARARNTGIVNSTADVVLFLDADDEWKPWFVERIAALFRDFPECEVAATGYSFVFTGAPAEYPAKLSAAITRQGRGVVQRYFQAAAGKPVLTCSSTGIRRSAFSKAGEWPQTDRRGMDLAMFTKLGRHCAIAFDPLPSAIYHIDGENRMSKRNVIKTDHQATRYINDFLATRVLDPELQEDLRRYRSFLTLDVALQNVVVGDGPLARQMLARYDTPPDLWIRKTVISALSYLPAGLVRCGLRAWNQRLALAPAIHVHENA